MVYMNLEIKEFTPEKIKEAKEKYIAQVGSNDADAKLWFVDDGDTTKIDEIEEDGTIHVISESAFGYISIDVTLSTDDMIVLIEGTVKKLDKFKNLLESLK